MVKKERRAKEVVTREYTINLHKKLHDIKFKSRAPRAIKEVRKFASKIMGTKDVRLDVSLNKAIWSKGIKNVPTRLRVVISRKRNEDEDATVRSGRVRDACVGDGACDCALIAAEAEGNVCSYDVGAAGEQRRVRPRAPQQRRRQRRGGCCRPVLLDGACTTMERCKRRRRSQAALPCVLLPGGVCVGRSSHCRANARHHHQHSSLCLSRSGLCCTSTTHPSSPLLHSAASTTPTRHAATQQEEMYAFVSVAADQATKGKGTVVVQDA